MNASSGIQPFTMITEKPALVIAAPAIPDTSGMAVSKEIEDIKPVMLRRRRPLRSSRSREQQHNNSHGFLRVISAMSE